MLFSLTFIVAGLALIVIAADWVIEGAEAIADRFRLPHAVVGLTLVAFGTSLPELVVAGQATVSGFGGLALGNVIGSNIANVLFVVGIVGLVLPFKVSMQDSLGALIALALSTIVFAGLLYLGILNIWVGCVFWIALLGFVIWQMQSDANEEKPSSDMKVWSLIQFALGVLGLAIGSELLVENAKTVTQQMGLRQEFLGLTIVAIGTSLPELAAVYASVKRNDIDIAIGNVVGSNLFNILAVGGAIGLLGGARISSELKTLDLPLMISATVLIIILVSARGTLSRALAFLMVTAFIGYMWMLGSAISQI